MRTDITFLDDFERSQGTNLSARGTVYNNRSIVKWSDVNNSGGSNVLDGAPRTNRIGRPDVCQDMKADPYTNRFVSVYAIDGVLKTQVDGGAIRYVGYGETEPSGGSVVASDDDSRPSIQFDANFVYIYHRRLDNGRIEAIKTDRAEFYGTGGSTFLDDRNDIMPFDSHVAIHATQRDQVVYFYNNEGAVSLGVVENSGSTPTGGSSFWSSNEHQGRIFYPTYIYTDADGTSVADLNYSAAVWHTGGSQVFAYFTSGSGFYGNVIGTSFQPDGTWTDFFEAVPADLSVFAITNALMAPNGTVHLMGKFQRIDPLEKFASTAICNLDLWGETGRTFSLDRFTLVSIGDSEAIIDEGGQEPSFRWFLAFDTSSEPYQIYISDCGRWAKIDASYSQVGRYARHTHIPYITSLSGSPTDGWNTKIGREDEMIQNDLIKKGNHVLLEVGQLDANGDAYNWFELDNCIIGRIGHSEADGKASLDLACVPETLWRISVMTHPFYLEIQSKQSMLTDADELDGLYVVSDAGKIIAQFTVDLWDEGELGPIEHEAGKNSYYITEDLVSSYWRGISEYPIIETLPITMKIYGWSRSGGMTHYEGGGDIPTDSASPNDDFYGVITIRRNSAEHTLYVMGDHPTYPPQLWYTGAHGRGDGAYPVEITVDEGDGLQIGDEIIKIGIWVHNGSTTDPTVFDLERIEVPEVKMVFDNDEDIWEAQTVLSHTIKGAVVTIHEEGVFYCNDIFELNPEWYPWNDGLSAFDMDSLYGIAEDNIRSCWYLTAGSGIYRSMTRGGTWELLWECNTAIDKIVAAGGDGTTSDGCGGGVTIDDPSNYGVYSSIKVSDSGGVYVVGGGRDPGGNFNCLSHKRLFYSGDGLISLEIMHPLHHDEVPNHVASGLYSTIMPYMEEVAVAWHCGWWPGGDFRLGYDESGQHGAAMTESGIAGWTGQLCISRNGDYIYTARPVEPLGGTYMKISTDGGITWNDGDHISLTGVVPYTSDHQGIHVSQFNPSKAWYCGHWNIWRTVDAGANWATVNDITRLGVICSSAYDDDVVLFGAIGDGHRHMEDGILFRSLDGGVVNTDITGNLGDYMSGTPKINHIVPIYGDVSVIPVQQLDRIGAPVIMFATKPYSTFNFEVAASHILEGEGSWGGVVGLATDANNYIGARMSPVGDNNVELIKVRNGAPTVLATATYEYYEANNPIWLMMTHRDGVFRVYTKHAHETEWCHPPLITYTWTEEDGIIALSADILHVGTYSYRDMPWVRIAGFQYSNGSRHIGIIPGRAFGTSGSTIEDFPVGGVLIIDDVRYRYTEKHTISSDPVCIRGPFQCRNTGLNWSYTKDGEAYSGNSVEFTLFEWLTPNSTYHERYANRIMASNSGYNWIISETDFQAGLTTAGVPVTLRNRSRHFGPEVTGDYHGFSHKMWITQGFGNITIEEGDGDTMHAEGTFAYLDRDNTVKFVEFYSSSGHDDCTVEDMIDKVVNIAGGEATFPGDTIHSTEALDSTWTLI